ncbi:MAG: 2-C-methyl-D-erythritol 4-phosphate cytidylyltransferase [Deltaproteobacteria bacterium]|nr:2-C-methyl-D-erythritol 4-phosphate cytidylyltransferase [Deltaproteobacteria bacterium]MBW2392884.1 2-C-methyl-D-erythritol 4-phosphate cytidylyltransferase [Deltaproteobacteria bacterium]
MSVAALVLAAGRGERLRRSLASTGGAENDLPPKAFLPVAGRTLLVRSLLRMAEAEEIDQLVPVVPEAWLARFEAAVAELGPVRGLRPAVAGGAERQDSVAAGLEALSGEVSHVVVHDAARPLVPAEDVRRVVRVALECGAALLATPVTDTIHQIDGDRLRETPARAGLRAALTPQVFRVDWLREALAKARADAVHGTDDAALVARLGVEVRVVEGDPINRKITTAADLAWAEAVLQGEPS